MVLFTKRVNGFLISIVNSLKPNYYIFGPLSQKTTKSAMVSRMREVNASPCPSGVFLTCVDARLQPSAFTQTDPGDMFIGG